jgi:hypothetical protein
MCSPFLVIEGPLGLSNYCFSIDPQRIWLEYRMGVSPRQRAIPCKSLQTTSDLTEILGVSQLCFNPLSIPLRTTAVDLLTFWGGDILKPVLKNKSNVRHRSRIKASDILVRSVKREEIDLDQYARALIKIAKAQVLAQRAASDRTRARPKHSAASAKCSSDGRGGDATEVVGDPGK